MLKVCKNGFEENVYNFFNFDLFNVEKCIGLSLLIKFGDKVEFINGFFVKILSRKISVEIICDN